MNHDPEAIHELADLQSGVSDGFIGLIRRKIHRRTTVNQYADFSWTMPGRILWEFLELIIHMFAVASGGKGRSK